MQLTDGEVEEDPGDGLDNVVEEEMRRNAGTFFLLFWVLVFIGAAVYAWLNTGNAPQNLP